VAGPAEAACAGRARTGPPAGPGLNQNQEKIVAANCDVCAKGPSFGHSISHSHVRTKRRWNPNIQRVRVVVAGTPKRLNVCTSCLKAGKVQRAV
jgi:large subunit ribosomal protein L28